MGPKAKIEVCQRIAQVRLEFAGPRGKSRFSKELGISPSTYDYYESSRVPPADVLVRIANLTDVDLGWLLTGEIRDGADETNIVAVQNHPILQRAGKLLSKYPPAAKPLAAFLEILSAAMSFPQKKLVKPSVQGAEKDQTRGEGPQEDAGIHRRKKPSQGSEVEDEPVRQSPLVERGANVAEGVAESRDVPNASPNSDTPGRTWIPILGRSAAGVPHFWSETGDARTDGLTTLMDLIERHAAADGSDEVLQSSATVTDETSTAVAVGAADRKETIQIITLREPIPWGRTEDGGVVEFVASERLKARYHDAFAVRIDGESMSPEIRHGNLVVLSVSHPAVAGQPAVVQLAGAIGVTCKLYHPTARGVHLVPINEQFPPSVVEPDDIQWALQVLARIQP